MRLAPITPAQREPRDTVCWRCGSGVRASPRMLLAGSLAGTGLSYSCVPFKFGMRWHAVAVTAGRRDTGWQQLLQEGGGVGSRDDADAGVWPRSPLSTSDVDEDAATLPRAMAVPNTAPPPTTFRSSQPRLFQGQLTADGGHPQDDRAIASSRLPFSAATCTADFGISALELRQLLQSAFDAQGAFPPG
jgi:hypothetical protein